MDSAVTGYLLDRGFAVGDVGDRAGERKGSFDRAASAVEATIKEFELDNFEAGVLGFDEALGKEADERGIVLMNALDGDTIGSGARGFGQGGPPGDVSLVQDAGPIDGADNDRLSGTEQDVADRFELIVAIDCRLDPATAEGMADRRSDVEAEGGDEKRGGVSGRGTRC